MPTCAYSECDRPARPKLSRGVAPKYCSRSCQNKASYERRRNKVLTERRTANARRRTVQTCPVCGAEFLPERTMKQKFCSRSCNLKAHRDSATAVCSESGCRRPVRAKGLCNPHYKAAHPNRGQWSQGKQETRRANLRRKTQRRRARLKGDSEAELIDRDAIGERDRWVCQLCRKPIDRRLEYPHRRSASLDHIVPLSKGGAHVRANVQIAHLGCNMQKGDGSLGEQLLLIG